jgi:hypothetical protein
MIGGNSAKAPPNCAGDLAKSKNLQELQEAPKVHRRSKEPKGAKGAWLGNKIQTIKVRIAPSPQNKAHLEAAGKTAGNSPFELR